MADVEICIFITLKSRIFVSAGTFGHPNVSLNVRHEDSLSFSLVSALLNILSKCTVRENIIF